MDTKQPETMKRACSPSGESLRREWVTPDFRAINLGSARGAAGSSAIDPSSST